MKIQVQELPRLSIGNHAVIITEVSEGTSEYKQIPFFSARMENEEGFVEQRFYDSVPSQPIIAELMRAVQLEGDTLNSDDLVGRELLIAVTDRSYPDPDTGEEKTIREAENFRVVGSADTASVR